MRGQNYGYKLLAIDIIGGARLFQPAFLNIPMNTHCRYSMYFSGGKGQTACIAIRNFCLRS